MCINKNEKWEKWKNEEKWGQERFFILNLVADLKMIFTTLTATTTPSPANPSVSLVQKQGAKLLKFRLRFCKELMALFFCLTSLLKQSYCEDRE